MARYGHRRYDAENFNGENLMKDGDKAGEADSDASFDEDVHMKDKTETKTTKKQFPQHSERDERKKGHKRASKHGGKNKYHDHHFMDD
jgi:hypothetical protein